MSIQLSATTTHRSGIPASPTARLAGVAAACLLAACSLQTDQVTMDTTVRGTATYRERMLLRPGSVLEVSVLDASRADAPAAPVASVRIENPGNPPFSFEIPIDASAIAPNRRYAARATIRAAGELIMTTDSVYPVLTQGAGNEVELLLRMVPREATATPLAPLPASFTGVLPCADCPGIDYHLDLLPAAAFYFKQTYRERTREIDQIGAWSVDADTTTLTLWSTTQATTQFRIVDSNTLRLLDRNGQDIESTLNYNLTRARAFDPISLALPLRGMYRYFADTGSFVECESGRRFVVAQEGDNAALESAYLAARRGPGDELLVSFDGKLLMRPPVEGAGMQPTVVVDAFTGVWPSETCGARMSWSELRGTNWVLTRIGDEPVVLADGAREARLVLTESDNRVAGFSGCNNFTGTVQITGGSIRFGQMAANLMACIGPAAALEPRVFAALENAASFELLRHHLDIYDGERNLVARFEARALD